MALAGLYRRTLPSPPAIDFASLDGKQLFAEALQSGNVGGFFKLISYFQTQSEPAYCGLASLAMVLNALAIDPGRKWKGIGLDADFKVQRRAFEDKDVHHGYNEVEKTKSMTCLVYLRFVIQTIITQDLIQNG
ncbi:glutathione gamma-glutamylcysteinyltransferase 1-like [Phoenix dactylifera]|uniref:glutathione gamma-glutamylcysteinyltransferase n=1 Tax=Phoenix dactylifera TaxID=42345 RepID=A0A8B9A6F8_PHODC|nr:glutathione gamma-glutamylcysteinyltransferase 1-like [Phoenix dactylifera]